jgi:1-phosphofructokinase
MKLDYIKVPGHTRTNIILVEMMKNMTTDINEEGTHVTKDDIKNLFHLIDLAAVDSQYLVMGGSLAKGMPVNMYGQVAKKYKDKCHVVIDADDDFLLEGLKGRPYLIKPNIHELENALDCKLETDAEVVEAGRKIIAKYGVTYVLVSMGKEGSILVTETQAFRGEAIETEVVSTVGAGDSMLAGFVFGLEKGMSLRQCLAFGSACSMLTISAEGYPRLQLEKAMEVSRKAKVYEL